MALNKDVLGQGLFDAEQQFNDKAPDELGDINTARLSFWKVMADTIIEHFKANGELVVPGTGLVAPNGAVTGQSITGRIQ